MKKLRLLLLAAFILSVCSCGNPETDTLTPDVTETTDESVSSAESELFTLPKENNNGEKINILLGSHVEYEFMVEEATGETVDDAVYDRNREVEEHLGVELGFESRPNFGGSDVDTWKNTISQSVLAGDDSYQIIDGINVWTAQLIPNGVFMNLYDISTIELDNPWWVSGFPLRDGKVYYAFNDAAFSLYKDLYVMFFNAELVNNYKLQNPYELALDGKWTLDNFIGMTKDTTDDLNGDGAIDWENDQIAYLYKHAANRSFLSSTECSIIKHEDGKYVLSDLTERLVNAYDKMKAFLYDNDAVYCSMEADYITLSQLFIDGRSLFLVNCLCAVEGMRDMSDDFGILPMPKYDESQESYHSQIATSTSAFYIPVSVGNPELVGKVCEAFGYYSMVDVIPRYYEVALKDKYTRDENVGEILDIIRESASTSFEFAYSTLFNNVWPNDIFNSAINNQDIASLYASNESSWRLTIENLMSLELP